MKKYLICGALSLLVSIFITSCAHDEDLYNTGDVVQQKKEEFSQAFMKAFGRIASNQNWGFDLEDEYTETPTAFETTEKAGTRGANVNGNLWYQNWERPKNLNDASVNVNEKALVEDFFNTKWENYVNNKSVTWENYWVTQVSKGTTTYRDGYNSPITGSNQMDKLIAFNNIKTEVISWSPYQESKSTWDGEYEHINNFNSGNNTTEYTDDVTKQKYIGTTLMTNMGTDGRNTQFGYHNSTDSKDHYEYIIIPGATIHESLAGYYYVGFDFYAHGTDVYPANKNMDVERDWIFNDWIVRISPAIPVGKTINDVPGGVEEAVIEDVHTTETVYEYGYTDKTSQSTSRIFCEDLGSSYSSRADFDYNDVVFDATLYERTYWMKEIIKHYTNDVYDGESTDEITTFEDYIQDGAEGTKKAQPKRYFATVDLCAAGGTIPITVFNQDVHDAFGVGETTMVNTFDEHSKAHSITDEKTGQELSAFGSYTTVDGPIHLKNQNKHSTLIDQEASDSKYNYLFEMYCENGVIPKLIDIPIISRFATSGVTELTSNKGDAPHKILVPVNTQWTSERCDIGDAYPNFNSWVGTNGTAPWNSINPDYVYDKMLSLSSSIKGDKVSTTTSSGSVTMTVYYENADGYDIINGLYYSSPNILSNMSEGDRLRVEVKDVESGYMLILSDGNSDRLAVDQTQVAGSTSGVIDFVLSQFIINSLKSASDKNALILSGMGLKVTKIGIIKK